MHFATSGSSAFHPFSPSEAQLESMILQLSETVLPGWETRKWKKRVYTPDGRGVEADLMMISTETLEWVVVEVELGKHSIKHHIRDQLERLSEAVYGSHLLPSLAVFEDVPSAKLEQLTRKRPGFLCIVDESSANLRDCCSETNFALATMRPFYNAHNLPGLLCDVPSEFRFRSRSGSAEYALTRSADTFFGKQAFLLPHTFPAIAEFLIRDLGSSFRLRTAPLGDARVVFAPPELVSSSRLDVLRLRAIDVVSGTFEMIRE